MKWRAGRFLNASRDGHAPSRPSRSHHGQNVIAIRRPMPRCQLLDELRRDIISLQEDFRLTQERETASQAMRLCQRGYGGHARSASRKAYEVEHISADNSARLMGHSDLVV